MAHDPSAIGNALRSFKKYRATFSEGGMVDDQSGLTVTDLDTAISAMEIGRDIVQISRLDLNDPDTWRNFEPRDG